MARFIAFTFLFCIFWINNVYALSFGEKNDLIKLEVIPQFEQITKNTKELKIISNIVIKEGWHLYWINPGDTGESVNLNFKHSNLYNVEHQLQSAPSKFNYEDIVTSYIHKNNLFFESKLAIKNVNIGKKLPIEINLSYSICKEECLPGTLKINFDLPIGNDVIYNNEFKDSEVIAYKSFPIKINSDAVLENNILSLSFKNINDCENPEFVSIVKKKDILSNLPITKKLDEKIEVIFDEKINNFSGVVICDNATYYTEPNISTFKYNLWYFILTAFIAGLILNLMPCVFPILSLKAIHLINNREKSSILSALSYFLGVICSFLFLASVLFYLRTKGSMFGWGFQLQSPVFNMFLFALFFLIFLSMIDKLYVPCKYIDKISNFSKNQSFLMGFFAVVVACPCTGPFMGAAIGYAITKPALIYFSVFTFLAIGYALPYVLIDMFPSVFFKHLPAPGYWMIKLKYFLSIPIALTCLWLGWVIFNQLRPNISQNSDIVWKSFSIKNVNEAIENNESVFINFTAKWCLVCLLNDKTSLSSDEFIKLVRDNNIRLFVADWTNKDSTISDALKKYGRNSVPLYVFHPANSEKTIILPQILTPSIIKNSLL